MPVTTQVDEIGSKLCNVSEGDVVELEFNHVVTGDAQIVGVDEDTRSADFEVLVKLESGDNVVIYIEELQRTQKHKMNHYDNDAFILKEKNNEPVSFGKVTGVN